jgi:hypothetical protein
MMFRWLVGISGAALVALTPVAAISQEAKPAQIDRNGVLILIRSTLIALDQANKTGNYTVLRDIGSPAFQNNTAAQLGDIFASQRRDKLDLSGVAVLEPQLTLLPEIEPNGMLRMMGFFPSVPAQVKFELLYAAVGGQWRLYGLSVALAQSGPVAPQAVPQAAAPQARAVKKPPAPAKAKEAEPSRGSNETDSSAAKNLAK